MTIPVFPTQASEDASFIRVALVQSNPKIHRFQDNLNSILEKIQEAASAGAKLIVFPECATSGYVYDDLETAAPSCDTLPGIATEAILRACDEHQVYVIAGMLERAGDRVYNSAFAAGPEGIIATYRKTHLPFVGVDRFTASGDALDVFELPFAKVGMLICYDLRFPEATRSLALQGADLLVLPTNWPAGAENNPDFLARARAVENRIFVLACDRVGTEAGTTFIGRSQIVAPNGNVIQEADATSVTILYADIEPEFARRKRTINIPGLYEFDPIEDRRPELYSRLQS